MINPTNCWFSKATGRNNSVVEPWNFCFQKVHASRQSSTVTSCLWLRKAEDWGPCVICWSLTVSLLSVSLVVEAYDFQSFILTSRLIGPNKNLTAKKCFGVGNTFNMIFCIFEAKVIEPLRNFTTPHVPVCHVTCKYVVIELKCKLTKPGKSNATLQSRLRCQQPTDYKMWPSGSQMNLMATKPFRDPRCWRSAVNYNGRCVRSFCIENDPRMASSNTAEVEHWDWLGQKITRSMPPILGATASIASIVIEDECCFDE